MPLKISTATDESGRFYFREHVETNATIIVNMIEYSTQIFSAKELKNANKLTISQKQILLEDITIVANSGDQ